MTSSPTLPQSRNAVFAAFALAGITFASLVSRLPDIRQTLHLSNGELGLLLLATSTGCLVSMPLAGRMIERFSAPGIVRAGAVSVVGGLVIAGFGATVAGRELVAALGLFVMGLGVSIWDVAMNVEGAEVERRLGRTIMPRFHAVWSVGSLAGSAVGIPMAALGVPVLLHLCVVGLPALVAAFLATGYFLPVDAHSHDSVDSSGARRSPWTEPRTLFIGVMVLAFALAEGSANDWLSLGVIDGYHQEHWVGVTAFSVFVVSMTVSRFLGTTTLDRFGRAPVLWGCSGLAAVGILITVFAGHLALAFVGIVIWGLGASLGFPVGMSAAADDPIGAAKRVSVVSTIGYGAFLIGPPLLGWIGDHTGTLRSLLVVAALMVPAALTVFAARERS
ncbi:MFS transporter [Nocardioides sp. Kera G14]|uniref:MFS transporter n=1 Tax=Nocardioides sp. Kera G14 TaxID=2884264 RepID=UPI001D12EBB2|nr:MFS transporter [Nocardioides sp. Kera G14]UDY24735.1 MFS transporter [Nocardioides sp. Kera G14]